MGLKDYGDDESEDEGGQKVFKGFDCPACDANNPYDDGFHVGDEIHCYYCGSTYKVRVDDSGRLRLREM